MMEFFYEPGRVYALDPGGRLIAEVTFPSSGGTAVIDHTFVDSSLRGKGVASWLLSAAVEQIRAAGLKARPTCSYAQRWFRDHPEAADLLQP